MKMTLRICSVLGLLFAFGAMASPTRPAGAECSIPSDTCLCDQGGCFDHSAPSGTPTPDVPTPYPTYVDRSCTATSASCVCDQGGCFDPSIPGGTPYPTAPTPLPSYEDRSCSIPSDTCVCDQGGCVDISAPVATPTPGFSAVPTPPPSTTPSPDYGNCDQGGCHISIFIK